MAADDIQHSTPLSPAPSDNHRPFFSRSSSVDGGDDSNKEEEAKPSRWGMGILNDSKTNEVPGMVEPSRYQFLNTRDQETHLLTLP
jgi:hypothetical protein